MHMERISSNLSPRQLADRLFASQHGVLTRRQALECGFTSRQIDHRRRMGEWCSVAAGVYRSAAVEEGRDSRSMAALLSAPPNAVLSHYSAARLHEFDVRPGSDLVWMTIPHGRQRATLRGTRIVRSRTIGSFEAMIGRRPVTTPARTLADLGEFLSEAKLRAVIYDAIRVGKTSEGHIREAWAAIAKRPRRNATAGVLADFEDGFDSGLEVRADARFREHGLIFTRQHRVVQGGRVLARLDFADPELKIGIEVDGATFHSSADQQRRDRERDHALACDGWITLRFTTTDITQNPLAMIRTIHEVCAQRKARPPEPRN